MNIKKLASLALAGTMVVSLAACGGGSSSGGQASGDGQASGGSASSGELQVNIWDNNQLAGLQEIANDWSATSGIKVNIRLNIDMHNAENLSELAEELHREFSDPKGISVYLHALFEEEKGSKALHDDERRKYVFDQITDIEARLKDYGFIKPRRLNRKVKINRCMADNDHSVVIVPNGLIGKCEHFSEDHFVGHIDNEERDAQIQDDFKETRDEIDACATCFNYPDCIWLKLCEDVPNCYQEERGHMLHQLRQSMMRAFAQFKNDQEDNQEDDLQDEI